MRGAEDVELLQGDAVVDRDGGVLAVEPVVDALLHVGGEDDAPADGERGLDLYGIQVLHHEDLLGVVVELVLRPSLVDDPEGLEVHPVGEGHDVAPHDGVGDDEADLLLDKAPLQDLEKVWRGWVEGLDAEADGLEVRPHRPLLRREDDGEGLRVEELGREVKAEIVCSVALERVHKHGDEGLPRHGRLAHGGLLREDDLLPLLVEKLQKLVEGCLTLGAGGKEVGGAEARLRH
mmetsp:Transcript_8760/g.22827  ORF Transcript_8760/g.22827 Transcript_8760/m.22827 type:complete len:234 (+) Transcript_8760:690-1391(+)